MAKGRAVTKAEFGVFVSEFKRWVGRLGLTQYRLSFRHSVDEEDANYAEISVNESGKVAQARLTKRLRSDDDDTADFDPAVHGRHEAFHLLLWRLGWLGEQRWCGSSEIDHETEAVVRRLEGALG